MEHTPTKESGYTIIELLVYIAVLAFMMMIIVSSLIGISQVYRQVRIVEVLNSNANTAVETIAREIRTAISVDTGASTLDSASGVLKLNSRTLAGDTKTVTFSLSSGRVEMSENAVSLGPITSVNATVSELYFEHIDTGVSEAVKYYATVNVGSGDYARSETFYNTIVLKGSYEI